MPKNQNQSITCRYFAWRLFHRDGVYYADGRGGKYHLGKHSLGTREREQALEKLRQLDEAKAAEIGVAQAVPTAASSSTTTIAEGWRLFFEHCDGNSVMGGASAATIKRYSAVRDKHLQYCCKHGIERWENFNEQALRQYGKSLAQSSADRTVYLELTLLKSVNSWLIDQKLLPATAKLILALRKPQGTDTYCYSSAEVTAIVEHCRASKTLGWLADVTIGLAHTGMRISELSGLRWGDVHLDGGILRVADERSSHRKRQAGSARTTKGKRSRTIPIHAKLRELLINLPRHADGFVFHAARGGRLRSRNVLEQFIRHVIDVNDG
jgi:integrase